MSTTPPNTPPPDYRDTWREQRRLWREHQRAARDYARAQREQVRSQWKAQRDQMKMQWRLRYGARRSSILGPLMLIALGLVFLLISLNRLDSFQLLQWFGQWWPALLLAAGVVLLAEWGVDEWAHRRDPDLPHIHRRIGGGVVFLIVLLVFGGLCAKSSTLNWDWLRTQMGSNDDLSHWFGSQHETDDTQDISLPAGASLSIENPHGDVVVTGSSTDGQIHLRLHKTVYVTNNPDDAYKQLAPQVTPGSSNVDIRIQQIDTGHASIIAEVPAGTPLNIKLDHGDIQINDINAAVNAVNDRGDVNLDGINGSVITRMQHGDFTAHTINGDITLNGSVDTTTISEVKGIVSLNGNFSSDVHLEEVNGMFSYHSPRTTLELQRINGNLELGSDGLTAQDVLGPMNLITRSKNVEVHGISGAVSIHDSNGNVELSARNPLAGIDVTTSQGTIDLTVPEHASFSIDAATKGGDVDEDTHASGLRTSHNNNQGLLTGTVGSGGPSIRLSTTHEDISLHEGSDLGQLPPLPAMPTMPKMPKLPPMPKMPKLPNMPKLPGSAKPAAPATGDSTT